VKLDANGKIIQRQTQQNLGFWQDLGAGERLAMMKIQAGKFTIGSPEFEEGRFDREGPQREVSVPEFYMGQTEVTQAQWRSVSKLEKVNIDLNENPSKFKGDQRPVETINWWEAQEFCDRLSKYTGIAYRLPSEAEWEYACRSNTTTPFYFGNTIAVEVVNYDGNSTYGNGVKGQYRKQTTDVKSFSANAWGLYDMHGNVYEWCADHFVDNYKDAPIDGSARLTNNKDSNRSLRGGSWFVIPGFCRSAFRYGLAPSSRDVNVGFRVVCRLSA
jgi:formylglycine-generating enzyme required for sulfatase activity